MTFDDKHDTHMIDHPFADPAPPDADTFDEDMTGITHPRVLDMHPTLFAVIVLAALWVLFFWRLLTPVAGDRVIFQEGDFPLHYFAYSDYQVERMSGGAIPLWNPYNYGGDPFAANVQWAVWYPPRWIAAYVEGPGSWRIESYQMEVAAHYLLISLGMYALLRALVKRPTPALIGSIMWTYGGYLTGYPMLQPSILFAIAWLPLMLLGAHLSITDPRWRVRGILLSALMFALSFFGGHTQTTMQMTYFTAAYIAFAGWMNWLRVKDIAWRVGLMGGAGAAISAVQLLPAWELMTHAYRTEAYHYAEKSSGFDFAELVQFMWPRLFGAEYWPLYTGGVTLLLVLLALWRPRREYTFWFGTMVVGLLLSLGGHSVIYDAAYNIVPGWNIFRQQERAAAFVVFAMVILASYELCNLVDPNKRIDPQDEWRQHWLARGHLVSAMVAYLGFVTVLLVRGDDPENLTANALGVVMLFSVLFNGWLFWRDGARTRITTAALGALVVIELLTLGMNTPNYLEDTAENRIREPDVLDVLQVRDWQQIDFLVDGAGGINTYGTYWRIPDIYGTGPFRLATLEKLRGIRVDRRWEVFAVRYATMTGDVPDNVAVKAAGEGVNYDGQDYTLYELDDPRPFAHLVYQARDARSRTDARAIMSEPWIDLREIAVVWGDLPFALPGERPPDAEVRAFRMVEPEYLEMEVSTSAPALLTLPVARYPGWRAEIDGEPVDIVDTYAGLTGIPIPAGQGQKITLQFLPVTLLVGSAISGIALILVLGWFISLTVADRRAGRSRPVMRVG